MDESGSIRFDADGLVAVVAQDSASGEVLMVAHMDREALRRTLQTGEGWYWSRSRRQLWRKGETSGHTQRVTEVRADCDGDALLLRVEQTGAACHTGHRSCFYRGVAQRDGEAAIAVDSTAVEPEGRAERPGRGDAEVLSEIAAVLSDRRATPRGGSYTTRLFSEGLARLNEKIMEEAAEVTRAARKETRGRLVEEVADLWFHTLALLVFVGVSPGEVFAELAKRRR
ncbi:MAG TPA: bifunctional phosphoribosyl-AMP cyclohydrolase/phosphoribosyl-ATP diphosphatase HisIE [bacterium]|nr:bifunctional phosphoribosyl-AMP cyclohydrolase/phosphoribosyl-ATP diphosphatase HisIE [bacterium]